MQGGSADGGRGGGLSYVKQACGCPLLCGVRTLFSGQFEHASVARLALAPLTHYTEPQQKPEYVASSLGAPPHSPMSLLYSKLRSPRSPPAPSHTCMHTGSQSSRLWGLGRRVTLTEHDRRQSLINHVYATGAPNII